MSWTSMDIDDHLLALAQRQLGARTKQETINRALALAAAISAEDRARTLSWLQENSDSSLDFDVLEERERSGA
ncbi:hypothetical protein GCM10009601_16670 [Streptomyces thermospinosisporus]|uniref:Type II toxin-antitoxin system VapB family antitoxin n=1 Tax=Streptomyces thermospinosisporus TaxID=161482 RepID=A0ABP4JGK7_9ACTN